ncbi:MAG: hypothetical protein ACLU5I_06250 [Alistipes finegoldii]
MGRITINGTMSQFSCKLTVRSTLWDAKPTRLWQKSRIAAHQREAGEYQDQYRQTVPASLRPGLIRYGRKGPQRLPRYGR